MSFCGSGAGRATGQQHRGPGELEKRAAIYDLVRRSSVIGPHLWQVKQSVGSLALRRWQSTHHPIVRGLACTQHVHCLHLAVAGLAAEPGGDVAFVGEEDESPAGGRRGSRPAPFPPRWLCMTTLTSGLSLSTNLWQPTQRAIEGIPATGECCGVGVAHQAADPVVAGVDPVAERDRLRRARRRRPAHGRRTTSASQRARRAGDGLMAPSPVQGEVRLGRSCLRPP